ERGDRVAARRRRRPARPRARTRPGRLRIPADLGLRRRRGPRPGGARTHLRPLAAPRGPVGRRGVRAAHDAQPLPRHPPPRDAVERGASSRGPWRRRRRRPGGRGDRRPDRAPKGAVMNELERILGEVADGVSRRTDALPVDALRSRGVRRRRVRQASFSAVGVAAAFGLALGAAQVLPGEEPPTAPALPSSDRSLPLGACGSIITSIPTVDASMSLDMAPLHLAAAPGDDLDLSMTVHHFGPGTLELDPATVPVLLVLREDVVVGWAWATDPDLSGVPTDGERTFDGFGPAVLC